MMNHPHDKKTGRKILEDEVYKSMVVKHKNVIGNTTEELEVNNISEILEGKGSDETDIIKKIKKGNTIALQLHSL